MSVTEGAEATGSLPESPPQSEVRELGSGSPTLLLVGNPNVGKTSLFNRLARRNERVGNYPGVTVERRSAEMPLPSGRRVIVSDVPGAYSLSARSSEEQIALQAILGWAGNPRPDLVIVVVDAGQLVRNLYLALQIIELRVPVAIALNMVDEAGDRVPSAAALEGLLGVRVVPTNARTGAGIAELAAAIESELAEPRRPRVHVSYPAALLRDVDRVAEALPDEWKGNVERQRALALWALSSLESVDELVGIEPGLRERALNVFASAGERDIDREIIESRYLYLEARLNELGARAGDARASRGPSRTERIDRVLLHPA
jgi:ferrous iron transport protein B